MPAVRSAPAAPYPSTTVYASYYMAASLAESVQQADLIVIGRVRTVDTVITTMPDQQDDTKPSSDSFEVGQLYSLEVERSLKGQGSATVPMMQYQGLIQKPPASVTPADIAQARAQEGGSFMVKGTHYLFVVQQTEADGTMYYHGAGYPWRYILDADGRARMDMPGDAFRTLPANFASDDANTLIARIEQLVQDQASATPVR